MVSEREKEMEEQRLKKIREKLGLKEGEKLKLPPDPDFRISQVCLEGLEIVLTDADIIFGKPKTLGALLVTRKTKNYKYNRIDVYLFESDLQIKARRFDGKIKWFTIKNFKRFTAREIVVALWEWNNILHDAIYDVYGQLELDLGWVTPPLCRSL